MITRQYILWIVLLLSVAALWWGCSDDNTTAPINEDPVITSVHAFPNFVVPSDSFAVFCSAYEPDGDSLFYDWSCTSGASVHGANSLTPWMLNHTTENVRVFYAPDSYNGQDSIRVDVHVRDYRGGGASAWVLVGLGR